MRKNTAVCVIATALVLMTSAVALPAARAAEGAQGDAALVVPAAQGPGPVTFHGLLRESLDWTLRLGRALRLLQPAGTPDASYGTMTIIDEPDPAGRTEDQDPLPSTRPRPVERDSNPYEDGVNGEQIPLTEFG